MREYFCAYHDMLGAMRKLSDAECGRLFRALLSYSAGDMPNNLQGREELLFDVFSQQIDRDAERYEKKCDINRKNRTTDNDRQRPSTNVNDRQRTSTNVNVRCQDKDKDKDKDKDDVARATAPSPLLTDGEMDAASAIYQQDKQAMLDAMERVGMQASSYNAETALALAVTYGAQAVVDALEKAAQHDRRGGISWAFVKAILEKPQQPQKPKTRKIRETLVVNGELIETVREVPYDHPVR